MSLYALGIGIIIAAGVVGGFFTLGIIALGNQSRRELDEMQADINRRERERLEQLTEQVRQEQAEEESKLDRWGRGSLN